MFTWRMWESGFGHVFSPVTSQVSPLREIRDSHSLKHAHAQMTLLYVSLVLVFSLSLMILTRNIHTHPAPSERVALGCRLPQRQRKPSPLLSHCSQGVNPSEIFWESGGNLHGPVMFTGQFILLSSPSTPLCTILPPPHELMIKLLLVCPSCSACRWAHPPYLVVSPALCVCFTKPKPESETNLKYAFSNANTRMFGNFATSCSDLRVCALPGVGQQ